MENKNFIIVLAWPSGIIFGTGSWYDYLFSKNKKYRAGHSALILINKEKKECRFFDFGRYHTPLGKGRVRDIETDPELKIQTKPKIKENNITNLYEILTEVKLNKSTHGEGNMYASVVSNINFNKAYKFAKETQKKGVVNYGPFTFPGTNCSRFVAKTIRKANPKWTTFIRLKFPFCCTPSPKRNISICNKTYFRVNKLEVKRIEKGILRSYFSSIEKCQ